MCMMYINTLFFPLFSISTDTLRWLSCKVVVIVIVIVIVVVTTVLLLLLLLSSSSQLFLWLLLLDVLQAGVFLIPMALLALPRPSLAIDSRPSRALSNLSSSSSSEQVSSVSFFFFFFFPSSFFNQASNQFISIERQRCGCFNTYRFIASVLLAPLTAHSSSSPCTVDGWRVQKPALLLISLAGPPLLIGVVTVLLLLLTIVLFLLLCRVGDSKQWPCRLSASRRRAARTRSCSPRYACT